MTLGGLARSRPLRWAAGLLAVPVLGLALGEASGWPLLREPLQRMLARAAAVPVTLGDGFRIRLLFDPHLRVERLTVGGAAGVPVPHLVDAQHVELAWRWRDLWSWRQGQGPLQLRTLRAGALDARLVRLADGRASWHIGPPRTADPERDDGPQWPRIGTLAVDAGHVEIDDPKQATQLRVDLKGSEGSANQRPGYEARAEGRFRGGAVRLVATAGGVLPLMTDSEDARTATVPLRVEGDVGATRLVFDGHAGALLSAHRLQGKLQLRGPSLAAVGDPFGVTLPSTPPFDVAGHLSHEAGVWQLRADGAAIGRSRLAGEFRYDSRRSPPMLSGRLVGKRLALQDLGRAVGAQGNAAESAAERTRVLPQRRFDLPSLRAMDADVHVAVDEFDFGTASLAPWRNLNTTVRLDRGVLQMQALRATVAGGKVSGTTRLDGNRDAALWSADLRFDKVDVAGLIPGLQKAKTRAAAPDPRNKQALRNERERAREGGDQPVRAYITGLLDATMKVQGSGHSTAEILASLDGDVHLRVRDGTLSHLVTELVGLDVAQALGVAVRGDQSLPLRCGVVDLAVENGIAVIQRAVLDNRDSAVRIEGRIDLRNEGLALRATARPKDLSPLSLRTPVLVTGTLGKPVVGIEGTRVAGRLLLAAVLGAIAGPAALLPLIDTGSGKTADPCAEPATAKPATPVPAK